jgi:hypothetical protein
MKMTSPPTAKVELAYEARPEKIVVVRGVG